ncbi:MAG: universal stress protein [Candidatus Methanomethylophilaceae archaeon]
MAFKSILVPTDGSEYTKFAVKEAIDLAAAIDAKITAVYVLDRALFSNMPMDTAVLNVYTVLEKEGKEAVEYVKAEGKKRACRGRDQGRRGDTRENYSGNVRRLRSRSSWEPSAGPVSRSSCSEALPRRW